MLANKSNGRSYGIQAISVAYSSRKKEKREGGRKKFSLETIFAVS